MHFVLQLSSGKRTVCLVKHLAFRPIAESPIFNSESCERRKKSIPCWRQGSPSFSGFLKPFWCTHLHSHSLSKVERECFLVWGLVTWAEPLGWDQRLVGKWWAILSPSKNSAATLPGFCCCGGRSTFAQIHPITSQTLNEAPKLRVSLS